MLDCILIDNSLRLIADDKYLLDFLQTEKVLLSLPFYLFVAGVILVFTNISIMVKVIYGLIPMICSFSAFFIVGILILRRHALLSAKLGDYALWGLSEIEKQADIAHSANVQLQLPPPPCPPPS